MQRDVSTSLDWWLIAQVDFGHIVLPVYHEPIGSEIETRRHCIHYWMEKGYTVQGLHKIKRGGPINFGIISFSPEKALELVDGD